MKRLSLISAVLLALPCIALATPVPDTGQTKCYDDALYANEINPCPQPGEAFYGQDAQYITNPQSYTKLDDNGNDLPDDAPWPWTTVRDNVTGLIWEVKALQDDTTNYSNPHDADNTYYWSDSIGDGTGTEDFINSLNSEQYGGYTDWRLPTVKELSSIVNRDTFYPAINTLYFPDTTMYNPVYWSSTSYADGMSSAWFVQFVDGLVYSAYKTDAFHVRAVRGEQYGPFGNYIDNGDGTVTDTDTGMMWQKDTAPYTYRWKQALSYCEGLSLGGYNDWRLPNVNELQSIVDYSRFYPIAPVLNTVPSDYWSSTTYTGYPSYAWIVSFYYGWVENNDDYKSVHYNYVRAVRGGQCGVSGDSDGDTVCNNADNCIDDYNPFQSDCDNDGAGDICDADTIDPDGDGIDSACDNCPHTPNPLQEDSYPPQGNGIGDACNECESDFACDGDVDGTDASTFKLYFGRNPLYYPCDYINPCNGDFSCDGDVDGSDASLFKQDFGRSAFSNPCPSCTTGVDWCQYQ